MRNLTHVHNLSNLLRRNNHRWQIAVQVRQSSLLALATGPILEQDGGIIAMKSKVLRARNVINTNT